MSIEEGTPLWVWPGARALSITPIRATALGPPSEIPNFGSGHFVRVRYEEGRRAGGTDVLQMSHVAVVHETTTPVLFGEPDPPPTGVTIDPDDPSGWKYPPERLRAAADALRPFLARGVDPLEAAVLVLDVDVVSNHEHTYSITTLRCVKVDGCPAVLSKDEFMDAFREEQRAHYAEQP